ncbi:MAG: type II methionyl aminopeptidase [Candidatus Hermodarchaeota archaeon]
MSKDWLESYIKAGKAVASAKRLARDITKPGVLLIDVANKCEEKILNEGCELSFPTNISLNEVAAHYSPPIDDPTIVPDRGLLKIDIGAYYDGYIADSPITINIDNDTTLQAFIDAAISGLEAAIQIFKPGVKLYELGEAIANKIINFGLKPIRNLGGHELKQYELHAGPFIPNYKDTTHKQVLNPGDAYACEPFTTSGDGWVVNGKNSYIYRFIKKVKKNMPYEELNYMNKIDNLTKKLPFSPRLLEYYDIIPKNKIQKIIDIFLRKQILTHYPILIEQTGAPVAQEGHTIVIDVDGNPIVTTRE